MGGASIRSLVIASDTINEVSKAFLSIFIWWIWTSRPHIRDGMEDWRKLAFKRITLKKRRRWQEPVPSRCDRGLVAFSLLTQSMLCLRARARTPCTHVWGGSLSCAGRGWRCHAHGDLTFCCRGDTNQREKPPSFARMRLSVRSRLWQKPELEEGEEEEEELEEEGL